MLRKSNLYGILVVLFVLGFGNLIWAASPTDHAVQTALQQELSKKFSNVQVTVEDRKATLTGAVENYLDKVSAERKAHKYAALTGVVNRITVGGATVADQQLAETLARKLAYDRTFGGNVFDAFDLSVENGVVTVSGYAHTYPARDSALGVVASEKGVKGVVDKIEVLPLSSFDDTIRLAALRQLYGTLALQKYAGNPAHPIRIIVRNGHLILEGSVLDSADRTIAGLVASGVSGAFSVTNNLQVDRS